jgi:hypothetical protein
MQADVAPNASRESMPAAPDETDEGHDYRAPALFEEAEEAAKIVEELTRCLKENGAGTLGYRGVELPGDGEGGCWTNTTGEEGAMVGRLKNTVGCRELPDHLNFIS